MKSNTCDLDPQQHSILESKRGSGLFKKIMLLHGVFGNFIQVSRSRFCLCFSYFFGGLECVGHFFANVAYLFFWERCQLGHPSPLRSYPSPLLGMATYLPYLATHLPTYPPISLLSHSSPYWAARLPPSHSSNCCIVKENFFSDVSRLDVSVQLRKVSKVPKI